MITATFSLNQNRTASVDGAVQYDTDQYLYVYGLPSKTEIEASSERVGEEDVAVSFHYAFAGDEVAVMRLAEYNATKAAWIASVPDEYLAKSAQVYAYLYVNFGVTMDDDDNITAVRSRTLYMATFVPAARSAPPNRTTTTQINQWDALVGKVNTAIDSLNTATGNANTKIGEMNTKIQSAETTITELQALVAHPLVVDQGGTGASTAAAARTNLGIVDSNGVVPVSLGGTGNATGNAPTAAKLATARTIRTNLGSTSTASFDGSANVTPGVTGTLPVANGGTGRTDGKAKTIGTLTMDGTTFDGSANVTYSMSSVAPSSNVELSTHGSNVQAQGGTKFVRYCTWGKIVCVQYWFDLASTCTDLYTDYCIAYGLPTPANGDIFGAIIPMYSGSNVASAMFKVNASNNQLLLNTRTASCAGYHASGAFFYVKR